MILIFSPIIFSSHDKRAHLRESKPLCTATCTEDSGGTNLKGEKTSTLTIVIVCFVCFCTLMTMGRFCQLQGGVTKGAIDEASRSLKAVDKFPPGLTLNILSIAKPFYPEPTHSFDTRQDHINQVY